jgi:hypothetical protein
MESARAVNVVWPALRRDLLSALLTSGLAAFGLVVLLLLMRRMAGALVQPLGGLSLIGVVGFGLALTAGWRRGWQVCGRRQSSLDLIAPAIPGFALFLLLCVLSLPGTASWALMLTWLAFFTCEAAWWWAAYSANRQPAVRRMASQTGVAEPAVEIEIESGQVALPNDVFQQITRCRDAEELERISIQLRIAFAVGQRVAVAHVAFCPPLGGLPDLAAEVMNGPDAMVTITNTQTFGVRLEVRLEEPADEACHVVVEIEGRVRNRVVIASSPQPASAPETAAETNHHAPPR